MRSIVGLLAAAGLSAGLSAGPVEAEVRVAATIKPIHSLVAAVMGETGKPDLILDGPASPHTAVLRPSQARMSEKADLIFTVGEGFEVFLASLIEGRERATVVELAEAPGVRLLPYREQDKGDPGEQAADGHGHDDDEAAHEEDHPHSGKDPHIWLDPENAKAMARHIAEVLGKADPANAGSYRRNSEELTRDLEALHSELDAKLASLKTRPFLVFHDAYHYLEARYGLNGLGGIVLTPETPPGARRLKHIRERIAEAGIGCVFSEPQFEIGYVRTVMEGTGARSASLDYMGVGVDPGPGAYRQILVELTDSLADCLANR